MRCSNCHLVTRVVIIGNVGRRCHGCKNPALDIPGNLKAEAQKLRDRAGIEVNPHMAKIYNDLAAELETEAEEIIALRTCPEYGACLDSSNSCGE